MRWVFCNTRAFMRAFKMSQMLQVRFFLHDIIKQRLTHIPKNNKKIMFSLLPLQQNTILTYDLMIARLQ